MDKRIGSIVTYKGEYGVVVKTLKENVIVLFPLEGNKKLSISEQNADLDFTFKSLPIIEYQGSKYLVSSKGTIISLKTGRVMKWSDDNGNRIKILALAGQ